MVGIQSATAENRRGKRRYIEEETRTRIQWAALLHRAAIIKKKKERRNHRTKI